jgi:kynureninase
LKSHIKTNRMKFETTKAFAQSLDAKDELKAYRDHFYFPQHNGENSIYLCGNSLGLQPKSVQSYLQHELEHWRQNGVEGHFKGKMPWMYYHKFFSEQSAAIVGAKPSEVVVMNTLTTNLHLMMVSFYRPTATRYKIIMEGHAFPSDQYAMESQVKFHGHQPDDAIIEMHPREGEHTLRTEDILATIEANKDEIALVMFSGVQYYTGQFFDLKSITEKGHEIGAVVGFDLAHAAGNVELKLHDWNVDFAVWCSYKYINSGPGGPSGAFVHERHAKNPDLPRFYGWWGHDEDERFLMKKGFIPMEGAAGWQLSNAPVFAMAPHKASLDIFAKVGIQALRKKSELLTAYMEFLLNQHGDKFNIITPKTPKDRGAQLSILTSDENGKAIFDYISENGVIADWREPNVIRVAAVPLYNSFEDVWKFVELIGEKA